MDTIWLRYRRAILALLAIAAAAAICFTLVQVLIQVFWVASSSRADQDGKEVRRFLEQRVAVGSTYPETEAFLRSGPMTAFDRQRKFSLEISMPFEQRASPSTGFPSGSEVYPGGKTLLVQLDQHEHGTIVFVQFYFSTQEILTRIEVRNGFAVM